MQHLHALLGVLADHVVDRATGATLEPGRRLSNDLQSRLWLGMLAPEAQLTADALRGNTLSGKLVPAAQGFTFRVAALPASLRLTVDAAVYVPLHPTVTEQREAATGVPDEDPDAPVPQHTQQGYPLTVVWAKTAIEPVTIEFTVDATTPRRVRIAETELAAALRRALIPPPGSQRLRPRRVIRPAGMLPRDSDLIDEVTWDLYAAMNLVSPADLQPPELRAALDIEVVPSIDAGTEILISVVNTTAVSTAQLFDGHNAYDPASIDLRLYEVKLSAETTAELAPYELEQVAKSYRYDRMVPAFGIACPVKVTRSGDDSATLRIETANAAGQETGRVHPRAWLELPGAVPRVIDTSFESLVSDPVIAVDGLVRAHQAWVDHHWSPVQLDRLQAEFGWDAAARAEADAGAEAARREVEWVAAGLELLRTDQDVRDAFVLANRAMAAVAGSAYTAWRPFQIAWIVGCLPGMVDPATHRDVDIVWFATGGGKSEAYLGLMATTLFYGRLTGVTAGTQVWARFPLRLLALQQTERFAAVVCQAELVRRGDQRIRFGESFGLGYYVGGGNTPNQLYEPGDRYYRGLDPYAPETAERCRILESCPVCDRPLSVAFDKESWTMQHSCIGIDCPLRGVLPFWGIDDEIYRHAPSVLVGTVDKLALISQNKKFRILLGRPEGQCPQHGYTVDRENSVRRARCFVGGCSATPGQVPAGFGHIRLEIADELHLLEESLGALDGMYETLLQGISEALGNAPLQVVGATATIEGYQNQVRQLYQRPGRRFPVNGPTVNESFWAVTRPDDPLRSYLGVRPRGVTMVNATCDIAVAHASWLQQLRDDPARVLTRAGLDPEDPDVLTSAAAAWQDLYEVMVAYCLRNEDLTSFTRDSDVQDLLAKDVNLATINGDASPAHVRDAVRRLTNPPADAEDRVRIIAATRAIGHGFDVARLGLMVVMGTPTQAAELIQASARVGRRWPGLVVNVINPTRDRDASVHRYYADWIRFLDRLVHKVPVNRESLPVLRRVLSGGLMAWVLQVHDASWRSAATGRKSLAGSVEFAAAVNSGFFDRQVLIDDLRAGFGISPDEPRHQLHRAAIDEWVDRELLTLPMEARAGQKLAALLHPSVPRSLRDLEESVQVFGTV
ncbi:helicase-related protein [Kribbella sp. NPDC056861]|uniref:helicase-related protein n=1 Tax=Kribbella sp. NPDC056861 TaxID=3154857 RepID=UPI00343A04CD